MSIIARHKVTTEEWNKEVNAYAEQMGKLFAANLPSTSTSCYAAILIGVSTLLVEANEPIEDIHDFVDGVYTLFREGAQGAKFEALHSKKAIAEA